MEILIYGAVTSAIYAMLAVGFTLIFGVEGAAAGAGRSADASRAGAIDHSRPSPFPTPCMARTETPFKSHIAGRPAVLRHKISAMPSKL